MSEQKFRIGDSVRIININSLLYNQVGLVIRFEGKDLAEPYSVKTLGGMQQGWFEEEDLELVEPAPAVKEAEAPQSKFKVGDRVRVRKPKESNTGWISPEMDIYDGGVYEIQREWGGAVRFKNCLQWAFRHEWLEPAPIVNECSKPDNVNHPPHYNQGGIECIEAIKAALGSGFPDYLRGNVMKYLWRCEHKGKIEDLRKAAWYLDRAIKEMEVSGE